MNFPFALEVTRRRQVFSRIGSFWSRIFKDPNQIRILLTLARLTPAIQKLESALNNLAGDHEGAKRVTFVQVEFQQADVFEAGMLNYDDPDVDLSYVEQPDVRYNAFRVNYWGLVMQQVLPLAIQSVQGRLILGTDFFIQAGKYILFRKDPKILFPGGSYLVATGLDRKYEPYSNYLTHSTSARNTEAAMRYFRIAQTPESFCAALSAEAGLEVLGSEQRLKAIHKYPREYVYIFENEIHRVDYNHDPLTLGDTYPKGYVIGEGIKVYQATESNPDWWRQIDWRGGISLDPFIAERGLVALDKDSIAYSAGSDPDSNGGSQLHARIKLFDDAFVPNDYRLENAQKEMDYWDAVGKRETRSGYYLNGIIGLPEDVDSGDATRPDTWAKVKSLNAEANALNAGIGRLPEPINVSSIPNNKLVNPLDVFFQAVLKARGFAIVIDQARIRDQQALFRFLTREMMTGCTPIILGYAPQLPIESGVVGDTIDGSDSVTVQSTIPIILEEDGDLSELGSAQVFVTQENILF